MTTTIIFGVLLENAKTDWPGRNQLMLALAEYTPVLLLERATATSGTNGWRRPTIERQRENLFVMKDALALRTHRLGRRFASISAAVDGVWFRAALQDAGMDDFVFWLTVNDPTLSYGIPSARLVYDCVDPNFLPYGQDSFDRSEFGIARRARMVFATAQSLYERMVAVNTCTYLLPNATGKSLSAPDLLDVSRPAGLRTRSGSVVGYLGTVDWRFDAEPVLAAATALPAVTFAIVGRVNADQEDKIAPLRAMPNVVFPGQVSREEGEAYTSAFDVGIIPFTPGEMNDAINPVKMYMYLAKGIPIVSTWIRECRNNRFVLAAKDPDNFAAAVGVALQEQDLSQVQDRKNFALANTWQHRARTAIELLRAEGMLR